METDSEGNLRFRQVLVSIARQNGKSVLGAVFALYGLLQMVHGAKVVGIASSVEQANIIYDRVRQVVDNSKALSKRLRTTGTRGIRGIGTSIEYQLKPAKPGAIQGLPVNLGLVDELHLETAGQCWDDIVNGQRAQRVALVIGITTAGDASSKTLVRLYDNAEQGNLGHFIYEGVHGAPVDDLDSILRANPAIACGRIPLEPVLDDVRSQPEFKVRRYLHNLFVDTANPFVDPSLWIACKGEGITKRQNVVIGIDRTSGWRYATVTAAVKAGNKVETQIIATLNNPSIESLKELVDKIHKTGFRYAMDSNLKDLSDHLRDKGRTVVSMNSGGYMRATETLYALIAEQRLSWNKHDSLVDEQMRFAKTRNIGGGYVLDTKSSDIDAIRSMAFASYVAETHKIKMPTVG